FKTIKSLTNFGNGPFVIATGDFNKDGKIDLAIANKGIPGSSTDLGGVLVFLGNGDGSFQSPASYGAGTNLTFITAADVNGDGAADLMVATRPPNSGYQIGVLLGNGNGTFKPATYNPTTYGPNWIAVGDLDGDGKMDLAIAHCCGATDTTFKLGN